ncbi:hypothetical protein KP509_33G052900 [Ceratopteris richardii]|nr:hypothetical protein KP509_33G052900 [Ceratopteris richardii]
MDDDASDGEHELLSPSLPIVFTRSLSGHTPLLKLSTLKAIARRRNKTTAQVILRWGLQRGTSVLPRSLHPDRIKTNFDILCWSLSEEDWNEVNSLDSQLRPVGSRNNLFSLNGPLQAVEEIDDLDLNCD